MNSHLKIKLEIIKKILKQWCESTTAHGLPNIARSEFKFLTLMWSCCFLASLSYCTYTIITVFIDFVNNKVNTNVQAILQQSVSVI